MDFAFPIPKPPKTIDWLFESHVGYSTQLSYTISQINLEKKLILSNLEELKKKIYPIVGKGELYIGDHIYSHKNGWKLSLYITSYFSTMRQTISNLFHILYKMDMGGKFPCCLKKGHQSLPNASLDGKLQSFMNKLKNGDLDNHTSDVLDLIKKISGKIELIRIVRNHLKGTETFHFFKHPKSEQILFRVPLNHRGEEAMKNSTNKESNYLLKVGSNTVISIPLCDLEEIKNITDSFYDVLIKFK
jgi:hypothetical protein